MRTALVSCSHSYMITVSTRVVAVQGGRLRLLTFSLRGDIDTAGMRPQLCPAQRGNSLFRQLRVYLSGISRVSGMSLFHVHYLFPDPSRFGPRYHFVSLPSLSALQPHHYISQPLSTGCSALLYFSQQGSNHQATPSGTAMYPHH